jgi:hypothetical protein
VSGVEDGAELGSSTTLDLGVEVTDATSGVASSDVTLDGEAVEPGALDLWTLDLGEHVLVVAATDQAGHTTESTVTFTVTTSVEDLAAHVDRLRADGALTKPEAARLDAFLGQATRHLAAGRDAQAAAALERFAAATDEEVLVRDAQALVAELG